MKILLAIITSEIYICTSVHAGACAMEHMWKSSVLSFHLESQGANSGYPASKDKNLYSWNCLTISIFCLFLLLLLNNLNSLVWP